MVQMNDRASLVVQQLRNPPPNAGDVGSIPGSGRSPGEWNSNPLQYSCLENPMDEETGGLQSMGSQRVGHDLAINNTAAAAAAKLLQSCPTLCDPRDGSPPGSPAPGILQARTLEWVAISFSNAGKWKVKVKSLSRVWLLATPWTAAHQAPPSMDFSRQEYWSGVPLPSPKQHYHHQINNMDFKLLCIVLVLSSILNCFP